MIPIRYRYKKWHFLLTAEELAGYGPKVTEAEYRFLGKDKQVNSLKIPLRKGNGGRRGPRGALFVDQLHLYALTFQLMLILQRQT